MILVQGDRKQSHFDWPKQNRTVCTGTEQQCCKKNRMTLTLKLILFVQSQVIIVIYQVSIHLYGTKKYV
jgi:hypothetical protein